MITCDRTVGFTAGHTDVCLWYVVGTEPSSVQKHDEEEFTEVRCSTFLISHPRAARPIETANSEGGPILYLNRA